MFEYLAENLATIIGSLIVLAVFGLSLYKIIRDSRNKKNSCGSGCSGCSSRGMCHQK